MSLSGDGTVRIDRDPHRRLLLLVEKEGSISEVVGRLLEKTAAPAVFSSDQRELCAASEQQAKLGGLQGGEGQICGLLWRWIGSVPVHWLKDFRNRDSWTRIFPAARASAALWNGGRKGRGNWADPLPPKLMFCLSNR